LRQMDPPGFSNRKELASASSWGMLRFEGNSRDLTGYHWTTGRGDKGDPGFHESWGHYVAGERAARMAARSSATVEGVVSLVI